MEPPSFPEKMIESIDSTCQPPGSSFFPTSDPYSDGTPAGAEIMGFPLTTFGISPHNILNSNNPYLVDSINPANDTRNISTYFQEPILIEEINQVPIMFDRQFPAQMYDEQGVFHLLLAYAEAIEMDQEDLAGVMVKRIGQKVSPAGDTAVQRLMYYMFQNLPEDNKQSQSDHYLKQEAARNFYPAFKAFYTMFPNGKLAHFAANSAIFASLTNDVKILRIFDFDIGEGIQWASLMEALGRQPREVVVTAIKLKEEDANYLTMWKFEDTKKRLCDFAASCGLILKVEQMQLTDLMSEDHMNEKLVGEFFAFNAMLKLPHMGRERSRKSVFEFFKAANNFLQNAASQNQRGVIIFGDGDAFEKFRNVNGNSYSSFLDMKMMHYQTLLESIYYNFPPNLGEARTCMECLFIAPFVSCNAWEKSWEEAKNDDHFQDLRFCFQGLKISQENLMEAKEIVKEGESLYGVRIEGDESNEMVMDWRGIPLLRVSCWRS